MQDDNLGKRRVNLIVREPLVARLGMLPQAAMEQINRGLCLALDLES